MNTQTCASCGRECRRLWPGDLCDECYYDFISQRGEAQDICPFCGVDLTLEAHAPDCENAPELHDPYFADDDPNEIGFDPYAGQNLEE
jgi:hypothetical protein